MDLYAQIHDCIAQLARCNTLSLFHVGQENQKVRLHLDGLERALGDDGSRSRTLSPAPHYSEITGEPQASSLFVDEHSKPGTPTNENEASLPASPPSVDDGSFLHRPERQQQPATTKVREAANFFLRDDLSSFLICSYPIWQRSGIWASRDVNTSILDSNRIADPQHRLTSAYQLVLEIEGDSGLNNVKLSFALLLLAGEDRDYQHSLDEMRMQSLPSGKPKSLSHASHAQNQALQKIHGTSWEVLSPLEKKKRKQALQRQLRCGRRIMDLEAALGLGVLLACNESIRHMYFAL